MAGDLQRAPRAPAVLVVDKNTNNLVVLFADPDGPAHIRLGDRILAASELHHWDVFNDN
jgi:hypothetical protein